MRARCSSMTLICVDARMPTLLSNAIVSLLDRWSSFASSCTRTVEAILSLNPRDGWPDAGGDCFGRCTQCSISFVLFQPLYACLRAQIHAPAGQTVARIGFPVARGGIGEPERNSIFSARFAAGALTNGHVTFLHLA